jgi:hypothetical protein
MHFNKLISSNPSFLGWAKQAVKVHLNNYEIWHEYFIAYPNSPQVLNILSPWSWN